ncbi:PR domain zinc finger protein 12 [Porphyridium purpureum]|uniref:PR domain zinc finger protein 12 n=1 Tax=Porphyridium purpureum TaxID=35688 RepID=A0A5J4Z525_PORPP|nr:PR domain zinc finger protein 12 [Porphyridium purpureum]|eukprot:POR3672..scf295_1
MSDLSEQRKTLLDAGTPLWLGAPRQPTASSMGSHSETRKGIGGSVATPITSSLLNDEFCDSFRFLDDNVVREWLNDTSDTETVRADVLQNAMFTSEITWEGSGAFEDGVSGKTFAFDVCDFLVLPVRRLGNGVMLAMVAGERPPRHILNTKQSGKPFCIRAAFKMDDVHGIFYACQRTYQNRKIINVCAILDELHHTEVLVMERTAKHSQGWRVIARSQDELIRTCPYCELLGYRKCCCAPDFRKRMFHGIVSLNAPQLEQAKAQGQLLQNGTTSLLKDLAWSDFKIRFESGATGRKMGFSRVMCPSGEGGEVKVLKEASYEALHCDWAQYRLMNRVTPFKVANVADESQRAYRAKCMLTCFLTTLRGSSARRMLSDLTFDSRPVAAGAETMSLVPEFRSDTNDQEDTSSEHIPLLPLQAESDALQNNRTGDVTVHSAFAAALPSAGPGLSQIHVFGGDVRLKDWLESAISKDHTRDEPDWPLALTPEVCALSSNAESFQHTPRSFAGPRHPTDDGVHMLDVEFSQLPRSHADSPSTSRSKRGFDLACSSLVDSHVSSAGDQMIDGSRDDEESAEFGLFLKRACMKHKLSKSAPASSPIISNVLPVRAESLDTNSSLLAARDTEAYSVVNRCAPGAQARPDDSDTSLTSPSPKGLVDPSNEIVSAVDEATGTSGWKCMLCGNFSNRRYNILRHIQIVHYATKRFCCRFCDQKFALRQHLDTHERIVHKTMRPFACNHCEQQFSTAGNLRKHLKSAHEQTELPAFLAPMQSKRSSSFQAPPSDLEEKNVGPHRR